MSKQAPEDPIVELLMKPENIGSVCEIYKAFPKVMAAGKVQLMKAVHDKCQERLKTESSWKVELDPKGDDEKRFEQSWPAIYIMQRSNSGRDWKSWYFGLSMNASEIPFKLEHGVDMPDKSVFPAMSKKLLAEVKKVEGQFKTHKFRTGPATGGWLSITHRPYKQCTPWGTILRF